MLAKRRTESEISRMKFERNSSAKIEGLHRRGCLMPAGIRLLRYPPKPFARIPSTL